MSCQCLKNALSKLPNSKEEKTLKELVVWARSQAIAKFKYGALEVEFHPFAFTEMTERSLKDQVDFTQTIRGDSLVDDLDI